MSRQERILGPLPDGHTESCLQLAELVKENFPGYRPEENLQQRWSWPSIGARPLRRCGITGHWDCCFSPNGRESCCSWQCFPLPGEWDWRGG